MNRVIFFIDGFNLYHAIDDDPKKHKYKWLNLHKLAECYVSAKDKIKDIYYFTALTTWDQDKIARHKKYIRALELNDVRIIYGKFKKVERNCFSCDRKVPAFVEKQTDVNIAIFLFKLAYKDMYDKAIIISGDSDLTPSIKAVRKTFPNKKIGIVLPIGRKAESLKENSDFYMKMKPKHLESSLLPEEIDLGDNQKLICPNSWR